MAKGDRKDKNGKISTPTTSGVPGAGVDISGNPVLDPTANVIALQAAATKRQDDIFALYKETVNLHVKNLADMATLRDNYQERLTLAESKRIDAIRLVDVNAVAVASQRASDQASVLAAQVQQSAEALRTLVASTAASVAAQLQQLTTTLTGRISVLEQSQYEGRGKSSYSEPLISEISTELRALREARSTSSGRAEQRTESRASIGTVVGIAVAVATAAGVIISLVIGLILHSPTSIPQPVYAAPQVAAPATPLVRP